MTLKEIAKKAGVSVATVSYALNNSAPVSDKTRERILEIAREGGYTSNALARSLRTNKTNTIGILAEDLTVSMTGKLIDGVNAFTERCGYNTILSNLRMLTKIENRFESIFDYQGEIHRVLDSLLGLQVDGIIYIGIHERNLDGLMPKIQKPLVYCHCFTNNPEDTCITYDNENISQQLTSDLIRLGHTRIGLITGMMDSTPSYRRMMGYQKAIMDAGLPLDLKYVKTGNWDFAQSMEMAQELLTMEARPTAIYAMNDEMAVGVLRVAEEMGLSVPEDLSVCGFDNASFIRYMRPKLTTVQSPLWEMGNQATQALLDIIDGKAHSKGIVSVPSVLKLGQSIGPCPV